MSLLKKILPLTIAAALVASFGFTSQLVRADGATWTSRTAAEANRWLGVAYGNGTFVAVASSGTNRVMTSTDGITWTTRSVPASNWTSVTYGNGLFVAVAGQGTDRIITSTDGITWTTRGSTTDSWDSITYGGGKFVAVGFGPTNNVMTSTDGITWAAQTIPATQNPTTWKSVTWGNNRFVAVSMTGGSGTPAPERAMTSTDGITWTLHDLPHQGNWNGVAFGNGTFVAVSSHQPAAPNTIATSTDGITWTPRAEAVSGSWQAVTFGGGKFVAVDSGSGKVMTSTDGITWAAHSASDTSSWKAVTYGDGIYVATAEFGSGARIMTSGILTPPTTTTTTTTTVAPSTTTTVPAAPTAVPGVTVTDTKVYARPPARVAASSAITMLTRAQNRTSDIETKTPAVCLPNDDELVFIDTGRCIAEVVNTKTRKVLRTLKTTVVADEVSELNIGNEIVTLAPIYFDNGSSTVTSNGLATLRSLRARISAAGSVLVIGHSGTLNGNTPENQALSRQRALSTVAALRAIKAQGPFSVSGVGALDPARSGRSEAAQARNRRVVVVLIP